MVSFIRSLALLSLLVGTAAQGATQANCKKGKDYDATLCEEYVADERANWIKAGCQPCGTNGNPNKIRICHGTSSDTNPYVSICVDDSSLVGLKNNDHTLGVQHGSVNGAQGNHVYPDGCPGMSFTNIGPTKWGQLDYTLTEDCGMAETPGNPDPDLPDGGIGGDPHIKTWAGQWFDYSGECDLVLIEAPAFAQGLGLDVHVRTKIRYDYSYISNAILKIADETFEVASFGDYLLNGVAGVEFPQTIAGYPISYLQVNDKTHVFSVEIGHNEHVRFKVFKDMVTIKFDGALAQDFEGSQGLMGSFDAKALVAHNGTAMPLENVDAIAAEWQVKTPTLFASSRAPQYPAKCVLPKTQGEASSYLRMSASAN